MRKKLLSIFVSLCMVITLTPCLAWADPGSSNGEGDEVEIPATVTITPDDMSNVSDDLATPIAVAIRRLGITNLQNITHLTVSTEGSARLAPKDNEYIKENLTSLQKLDESGCRCTTKEVDETILQRSYLDNVQYEQFGGLSNYATLEELVIPQSAQVINFYSVKGLSITSLTIPDSVLIIESGAFSGNTKMTADLVIPDSVCYIGNNAFGAGDNAIDCGTLTLGNSLKYIDSNGFKSRKFSGNLVLPDSLEVIGNWVFAGGSFANGTWTLSKNLKSVGDAAMSNICSGNTGTFVVPAGLAMGDTCFGYNTFGEVVFADGVQKIGTRVIRGSKNVTKISIPSSVVQINTSAFSECTALTDVVIADNSKLTTLDTGIFSGCTSLTGFSVPETIQTIGSSSFENSGLNAIFIPEAVTEIQSRAFRGLLDKSVVYLFNSSLYEELNSEISYGGWNMRLDYTKTAIAITNGGTFSSDEFTLGQLATPTREGYVFAGWFTDADLSTEAPKDGNNYSVSAERVSGEYAKTYYAKWASSVKFDVNGGEQAGANLDKIIVDEGQAISSVSESYELPTGLSREGYDFAGWNTKADGTGAIVTESTVPAGNTTYYAQWTLKINENADEGENIYTVTAIPNQMYTGEEIRPTVVVKNSSTGDIVSSLQYTVEYSGDLENVTGSDNIPTVKVTINSQTASLNFRILKDVPVVSLDDMTVDYGAEYTLEAKAQTTAGNAITDGIISIKYYKDENCTEGEIETAPTSAGEYWAKATLSEACNYSQSTKVAKITINRVDPVISITPSNDTLSGAGSVTLAINAPAEAESVTVSCNQEGMLGDGESVVGLSEGDGTLTVSLPNETAEYTFTVTYSETENYNAATKDCTVSVTKYVYVAPSAPSADAEQAGDVLGATEVVNNEDGSTTTTITADDGTKTTIHEATNGVTVTTVEAAGAEISISVDVPETVDAAVVTIPTDESAAGLVAVNADTGEVIKLSAATDNGVAVAVTESVNIKLVDNSKTFTDVDADYWGANNITFATAHELFQGTSATTFAPEEAMNRYMLMTVLARLDGESAGLTGDDTWYVDGMQWAQAAGVSNGLDGESSVTREQMVTMLYRYAGEPSSNVEGVTSKFPDAAAVSDYAQAAMAWAVDAGIIQGVSNTYLDPQGSATRAQVAAVMQRYVEYALAQVQA